MNPQAIRDAARAVAPEIIELRRELHRHPEIRFEERWTSDRIARFFDGIGVSYTRGWAKGTGIVAELKGTGGKTVALRADIDALELAESADLPYASENTGRMHACGHDGHIACLCGTAKVLAKLRDRFDNTVRFIYQPAEEIGGGGRFMAEEGAVDGADVVFGLHAWPELPVGKVGVRPGPAMAGADWFGITIRGCGCHGAHPDMGVDPVLTAAHVITALQTIVSREIDPTMPAVVTVAQVKAGFAENIIPETARIEGTFRTFSEEAHDQVACAIKRIAVATAAAFRAEAEVDFGEALYDPLINDPKATACAQKVLTRTLGPDNVIEVEKPSMGAEDFACYLKRVPGSLIMLGMQVQSKPSHPLHSPRFNFNDDSLLTGITALAALAISY